MQVEAKKLVRLFPDPGELVPLHGLYLRDRFAPPVAGSETFVYANFTTSLDGRISLPDPRRGRRAVPRPIANARDWRLFQELAACADARLTSAQYARNLPQDAPTQSSPTSRKPEHA